MTPRHILGIDPGTAHTGWAVLECNGSGNPPKLLGCGMIRTSPSQSLPERLKKLHQSVSDILCKYRPNEVAIEEIFFLKAARTVGETPHARGVILLACAQQAAQVEEYNPRAVKMCLTGNGNAGKLQVQKMVKHLMGLAQIPRPTDIADAIAIAICHIRSSKLKSLINDRLSGGKSDR